MNISLVKRQKSLKSIPISHEAYDALKNNRATFNIHGGVSKSATFDDATDKVKSFKLDL